MNKSSFSEHKEKDGAKIFWGMEHYKEEVISKVGYIGRVFGSEESAKNNYLGCTLFLLVLTSILLIVLGYQDSFTNITPIIGTIIGYFCKK